MTSIFDPKKIAYSRTLSENSKIDRNLPKCAYKPSTGQLYVTGGTRSLALRDDVLRSGDNGVTWEEIKTNAGTYDILSVIAHDDGTSEKIMMTAGLTADYYYLNETTGAWASWAGISKDPTDQFIVYIVSFLGKLFVCGTYEDTAGVSTSQVSSTVDGVTWTAETGSPGFAAGYWQPYVVGDRLYVINGYDPTIHTFYEEVWYTENGSVWFQVESPDTILFDLTGSNKVSHDGKFYIWGGTDTDGNLNEYVYVTEDFINYAKYDVSGQLYTTQGGVSNGSSIFFAAGSIDPINPFADAVAIFGEFVLKDFNIKIDPIADYQTNANNRLLFQYKHSDNIKSLLHALSTEPIQELENAALKLYRRYDIDLSEGAQLDVIGNILNQPRGEVSDALYKIFLKGKAALNSSEGTFKDIYDIVGILTNASLIKILPVYPAGILIYINTGIASDLQEVIFNFIEAALAAGVELDGIRIVRAAGWFGWDDDPTAEGFDVGLFDETIKF